MKKVNDLSKEEILKKLQRYCAYQDRCHQEVRTKLIEMAVYGDILEEIISDLIKDDFLNELRYAKSFAVGKFRQKKWGRVKIEVELKNKNISPYCINKGLLEIPEEEYIETLRNIIRQQREKYHSLDPLEQKHKCYIYCVRKGFEVDLVLKYLPD